MPRQSNVTAFDPDEEVRGEFTLLPVSGQATTVHVRLENGPTVVAYTAEQCEAMAQLWREAALAKRLSDADMEALKKVEAAA